MNVFTIMHTIRYFLAAAALAVAGCVHLENPFEGNNRDMTPLDGAGETPTIKNRFPESHGGLPLSETDREDRDMTPFERLKQY